MNSEGGNKGLLGGVGGGGLRPQFEDPRHLDGGGEMSIDLYMG